MSRVDSRFGIEIDVDLAGHLLAGRAVVEDVELEPGIPVGIRILVIVVAECDGRGAVRFRIEGVTPGGFVFIHEILGRAVSAGIDVTGLGISEERPVVVRIVGSGDRIGPEAFVRSGLVQVIVLVVLERDHLVAPFQGDSLLSGLAAKRRLRAANA